MAMTLRDLQIIEYRLTDRDREILRLLKDTRSLFTYHIRRVCFAESANTQAAARACNRTMKRLRELGLVDALTERRIGGVRAGSASYIWYLTEQGNRLLNMDNKYPGDKKAKRTRFIEPADSTLGHRMAVNECFVQLTEIARRTESFRIKEVSFEPRNWKHFEYKGKQEILKPDLFIATVHHRLEFRFFVEMDLSTESIDTVLGKCIRYHRYMQTGIEQDQNGVFPITLWIVKDEKRKVKMEDALHTHLMNQPNLFIVITADEFETIMTTPSLPEERLC